MLAISSMHHDTDELLKEILQVTSFAVCFINDEIMTDTTCEITVSQMLWGFSTFAIILEIL